MLRILFVEDDKKYQSIIKELLETAEYEVDVADDAAEGLELFKQQTYDLILTDYAMDGVNGIQFLELLKRMNPQIKMMMLTGIDDDLVELQGLNLLVDDYLKKPIGFEVLLKRIELVLQDSTDKKPTILQSSLNNLIVYLQERKVKHDNEIVRLTTTEFNILVCFLQNKNKTLERETLLNEVWRGNQFIESRTVDTHVKNLRSKLKLSCIYSIRGVGYEWVE